jgi:hypothetical protein
MCWAAKPQAAAEGRAGTSLPEREGWRTETWHVTNACFAKMWGYDISFRPEKSAPFVIGKVEVSLEAFKD